MSSSFRENFLSLIETSFKIIQKYPGDMKPSYINLSTMTMVCDLTKPVDILLFSDNFKSPPNTECTIKRPQKTTEFNLTKRGKKRKTFFNQASIHFTTHTTKCIKVFSNGRLHITGVTSLHEAQTVSSFVCDILNETLGAISGTEKVQAKNLEICMINTNFALNHGIDILKLKQKIIDNNIVCHYTPDTYPGLKIKYSHDNGQRTSVFIFSSGQIVITGAKSLEHISYVYTNLFKIIIDNYEEIFNPYITVKKSKAKTCTTLCNGYDVNLFHSTLV